MGRIISLFPILCFFVCGTTCFAQTSIRIPDPRIELKDNVLHIYYDLLNSDLSDKFVVTLEITNAEGNKINANALEGDIGEAVDGGRNKHVTWDLQADEIVMNAKIYIEINARLIPSPEPDKEMADQPPVETERKSFSRSGIILQSIVLPGLGLSRVTGKPHWLKGVAGYGCIAGSIILNQTAQRTYDQIDDTPVFDDKRDLHAQSVRQDNISEVLAYAAIGVWASDLIWTSVGTSDMNDPFMGYQKRLTVKGSFDPLSYAPLLSVSYRF